MKLESFMKKNKFTDKKMAELIEVKPISIYRYRKGKKRPEEEVMLRIFKFTKGLVTPNDFYELTKITKG